jgi:hypothetical protein
VISQLSLGRLQQPLPPPPPELLQHVLQQLPGVLLRAQTVLAHQVPAMPALLPLLMPLTKSTKTVAVGAVTAGRFGVESG